MVISYVFYVLNLPHDIEWHGDGNGFYIRTLDREESLIKRDFYDSYCKKYTNNITLTEYSENQGLKLLTIKNKRFNREVKLRILTSYKYMYY